MRNHNSHVTRFYTELLVSIYHDMVGAISSQYEIARDIEEIRKRVLHEGLTFFTKVLPALGKSIDVSLANGTPLQFSGFKTAGGTKLPAFMQGAFGGVFRVDGVPWFATWYADISWAFNNEEGNPDVDNLKPGLKVFEQIDAVTRKEIWDAIEQPSFPSRNVSWDGRTYPGSALLHEIRISSLTRDCISVGVNPARTPPGGQEAVLNSRRETAVVALRAMRQVCYCFYKLDLPYTDEQESKVLEDFVSVDRDLGYKSSNLSGEGMYVLSEARKLICRVLANADPLAGRPRHGPGAVATGEKSPEKQTFKRYYEELNKFFPYADWFFFNASHLCDSLQELQAMEQLRAGTAKVVLVPKDSRGPRLISCEPLEYQWIQQSLMGVLTDTIESHRLTKGYVNFTDQEINRRGAIEGSKPPYRRVTLDMKEASDRVSLELVKDLFPERWFLALYASRSPETRLPNGTVVPLNKFAPMGSAVCFPVEALVFWALCVSIARLQDMNRGIVKPQSRIHVYGDDIICDADYHDVIISTLPKFGLMLNQAKCCLAGPFKESCGMDAFHGMPVTPTKISSQWFVNPESGHLASYVAYANACYRDGMFETAKHIRNAIQVSLWTRKMHGIPTINRGESSVMAFVRPDVNTRQHNPDRCLRFNRKKQRMEVKSYVCDPKTEMSTDLGWNLITRLMADKEVSKDPDTLLNVPGPKTLKTGQYAIVHRDKLKRTWTPLC